MPVSLTTQLNAAVAVAPLSFFLFHLMPGVKRDDIGCPGGSGGGKGKKEKNRVFGAADKL